MKIEEIKNADVLQRVATHTHIKGWSTRCALLIIAAASVARTVLMLHTLLWCDYRFGFEG